MATGFDPLATPIDKVLLAFDPPKGQQVAWQVSPGLATVQRASSPRRWDQRQGYGLSGSFPVFFGLKLAEFDILLRLYTSEDWAAWASWSSLIAKPPAGTRPKALACYHPWLADLDIGACVVTDVLQPEEIDNGGYLITIQCLQWRRPKIALSKPEAAKTNASTDPIDAKITALTAQLQELAK
jgi:hypothetical protein